MCSSTVQAFIYVALFGVRMMPFLGGHVSQLACCSVVPFESCRCKPLHSFDVISRDGEPFMIYQSQAEMSSGIVLICRDNAHARSLLQPPELHPAHFDTLDLHCTEHLHGLVLMRSWRSPTPLRVGRTPTLAKQVHVLAHCCSVNSAPRQRGRPAHSGAPSVVRPSTVRDT